MEKVEELLRKAEYALFEARNEIAESKIPRSACVLDNEIEEARRSVQSMITNISVKIRG